MFQGARSPRSSRKCHVVTPRRTFCSFSGLKRKKKTKGVEYIFRVAPRLCACGGDAPKSLDQPAVFYQVSEQTRGNTQLI